MIEMTEMPEAPHVWPGKRDCKTCKRVWREHRTGDFMTPDPVGTICKAHVYGPARLGSIPPGRPLQSKDQVVRSWRYAVAAGGVGDLESWLAWLDMQLASDCITKRQHRTWKPPPEAKHVTVVDQMLSGDVLEMRPAWDKAIDQWHARGRRAMRLPQWLGLTMTEYLAVDCHFGELRDILARKHFND